MPITCPICMDTLVPYFTENLPGTVTTECGHVYHFVCLQNWMESNPSCPQCRSITTWDRCTRLYLETTEPTARDNDDVLALQTQLESLKFDMKICLAQEAKKEAELKKGVKTCAQMRKQVKEKELMIQRLQSNLIAAEEHSKTLQRKIKSLQASMDEMENLKRQNAKYAWVDDLLNGIPNELTREVAISPEECKKLFINFKRLIREEREARKTALRDNDFMGTQILKQAKVIKALRCEVCLLKEVVNAYKQKEEERNASAVAGPSGIANESDFDNNNVSTHFDDSDDSSIIVDTDDDDFDYNRPSCSRTQVVRRSTRLQSSEREANAPSTSSGPLGKRTRGSPALANKFKVVSKRRKML